MNQEHKRRWWSNRWWRNTNLLLVIALAAFYVLILISIIVDDLFGGGKISFWEWVGVLIIPVALLAAGFWINATQIRREETATNQRAQDEALRQYLDQMSNLIVDKKLRGKSKNSDVHLLAQARTTALLLELDEDRKRRPLKLVYRLHLINRDEPLLDLRNAALDYANLSEITLTDACLKGIDLRMANLRGANLSGTDLGGADLRGADLSRANLTNACLRGANLLPYDEQDSAKLNAPNLNGVDLSNIDLSGTDLKPTDLSDTILREADLKGAYLRGAKGLYREQVEQARGDLTTRLPDDLGYPVAWSTSPDGQPNTDPDRVGTRETIREVSKEVVRIASLFAASVLAYQLLDRSRRKEQRSSSNKKAEPGRAKRGERARSLFPTWLV